MCSRFPALWAVTHVGVGFGDEAVFEPCLLQEVILYLSSISNPNKSHRLTKLDFGGILTWSAVGSTFRTNRDICSFVPRKSVHQQANAQELSHLQHLYPGWFFNPYLFPVWLLSTEYQSNNARVIIHSLLKRLRKYTKNILLEGKPAWVSVVGRVCKPLAHSHHFHHR